MDTRNVMMVGFCSKGILLFSPLVQEIYGVPACKSVSTIEELAQYNDMIDSIFLSALYIGLDIESKISRIRKLQPGIQIVVMASHYIHPCAGKKIISSGADVLYANIDNETEYKNVLSAVRNKFRYYPKDVRDAFNNQEPTDQKNFFDLTPKERQCLELTLNGISVKSTAHTMHVTTGTVGNMRKSIKDKMGANSLVEMLQTAFMYNYFQGGI
ncbi:LuxR C-terminal-related transcriptional regulator [Treponema zuelzerae]|uniref:LuxR C-terminal-related transcriptional regulator n=1 Tax=Teretinema zuelzerae TaxID=156 RepID=A0AAE3EGV6_9SPIR|nr:LuxR C-terminal-related transcriptional regulator [Teretinema zuelzerae]MCD1653598.1 LuxR C-terminal-related transcriptional regulator [Teretinema zuelzerae]